jgi:hypothetical protein
MNKSSSIVSGKIGSGGILFVVVLLYFLFYFNYGINLFDEGILMEGIRLEQQGQMQYDKFCHYSSQYRLLSYILSKTENDLLVLRLIWVLVRALTALLIFSIARRLVRLPWALVAVLLFLALPGPWHKSFVALLVCLPTYLMVKTVENGKPAYLLAVAASLSAAVAIHIYTGGLTLLGCAILFGIIPFFENRSPPVSPFAKRFWYGAFWSVFLLLTFLLADFLRQIDYFAFLSMTRQVLLSDYAGSLQMVQGLSNLAISPKNLVVLFIYFGVAWTMIFYLHLLLGRKSGKLPAEKKKVLIILVVIALLNLAKWLARFDMAHLLQNAPLVWILGVFILSRLLKIAKNSRSSIEKAWAQVGFGIAALWIVVAIGFGLSSPDYYSGGIGYRLFNNTVHLQHPKATMHVTKEKAEWIMKMVRAIRDNTEADDTICIMAPAPILYYLSDRKSPFVLPLFDRPESLVGNLEADLISQLKRSKTKLIVYKDEATDGVEKNRLSQFAPNLHRTVMTDYTLLQEIDGYQIRIAQ